MNVVAPRRSGPQRLEFRYDYVGRRIEKKVFATLAATTPTQHVKYVYDGWNLIAEVSGATPDTVLRTFTWGLDASGRSHSNGSVTSYYSTLDVLRLGNALTPASVPGNQVSLGVAGFHGIGGIIKALGRGRP